MSQRFFVALAIAGFTSGSLSAARTPASILAASHAAMGGDAWNGKSTLEVDFDYVGQGLKGTTRSIEDVSRAMFVDSYDFGTTKGSNGFDGSHVWLREPSGTVTLQGGGDTGTLAVNESYRDGNLWWRPDFGGAAIAYAGQKADGGRSYDVLTVTPKGGKAFDAWFDAKSHLLARTVEVQATLTITTFYSDYSAVDGAEIAHKVVVDDSTGLASRQTMTLTKAAFGPPRPVSDYGLPPADLHDSRIVGGAAQTTVPFKLMNNHIYAEVSVNGSKPLLCEFDTGGQATLTPATAKALGIKVIGATTETGSGNNTATSGQARVNSIQVGDAIITDQPVSVFQFDSRLEGIDRQGMIGYEFFARFATVIDYGKHTLTFIDPKAFDPKDAGTAVPFRFFGQFPEMLGSYDGIPGRFGIDTGAHTPLTLNRAFVEQNDLKAHTKSGVVALTSWGVGGPSMGFVTHGGTLKLGDLTIEHPLTEYSLDRSGGMAAAAFPNNVGGGVLKRFVVTLDYAHYRMFFKPIEGPLVDVDTFDRSGMRLNVGGGGFEIAYVTNGGPADQAGLKKGDVILGVNGKPVSDIPLYALRQMLRDKAPGTPVTLSVKTTGGRREVMLTLRDMV